jgi:hypothetical protein
MLIEIDEIHPPKPGGKMSKIVAAGERYDIWPDKLDGVAVGRRYEVEIKDREFNGRTFKSIAKIAPAAGAAAAVPTATAPAAAALAGEAEYVGRVLAALIVAGAIEKQSIPAATAWLRKAWRDS